MNCKYCGAALPTQGGVCPNCGKMIPVSQQKEMREMLDPRWNQYRNKDTGYYKSGSNNDTMNSDEALGKKAVLIIGVILAIIILLLIIF